MRMVRERLFLFGMSGVCFTSVSISGGRPVCVGLRHFPPVVAPCHPHGPNRKRSRPRFLEEQIDLFFGGGAIAQQAGYSG